VIGVIANKDQAQIVEEFFQLFKTPWEFYDKAKSYDAVICSGNFITDINARLLIVYGSDYSQWDVQNGLTLDSSHKNVFVRFNSQRIPIYRNVSTYIGGTRHFLFIDKTTGVAGTEITNRKTQILRVGYDLFDEIAQLLSDGQPNENALIPTLDRHISLLRSLVVNSGISLAEILPTPTGFSFITCLTHDVDFVRIRQHKFDKTMWGFLYRASIGSFVDFVRRRISVIHLMKNWKAVVLLPLVYLGMAKDYWLQFDRYMEIETGLASTYFFIPFKHRRGDKLDTRFSKRRAAKYDITELRNWIDTLLEQGHEIGVHGIDAWHSPRKGREEYRRVSDITGETGLGVRIHWLCYNRASPRGLDEAGFSYDSTFGYNDAVGYRGGTTQVFRPIGTKNLLELPFQIQDTALFYPKRMGLSETQAWEFFEKLIRNSKLHGGALTILWHQRSLAPERLWANFYIKLLNHLKSHSTAFWTAKQVTEWFQKRRAISFKDVSFTNNTVCLSLDRNGETNDPGLTFRIYSGKNCASKSAEESPGYIDVPWNGESNLKIPLSG
jgi:hypothetical protein